MTQLNPVPTEEQIPVESKAQMDRKAEDTVTPIMYWGTIIQAAIMLLMAALATFVLISLIPEDGINSSTYIAMVVIPILAMVNVASLVFTIRKRQDIGYGLSFFSFAATLLGSTLAVQGVALSMSFFFLVPVILGFWWIWTPRSRRFYGISTVVVLLLTWVIEWINPPWRTVYEGTQFGPTAAIVFAILVFAVIVRQAWQGNIRVKLLAAFISVTLIATTMLGIYMYITTGNNLRDNLERELTAQSTNRATRIGDLLDEQINTLTTLSLNEAMRSAVARQNNSYFGSADYIQATLNTQDEQWRVADAADNNEDTLVQWALTNAVAKQLIEYQRNFPANAEVFVTDVYGGLVGTSNRTSDYYQADEGWWQAAYNNGQGAIYVSDPEFDESANALAVLIALPLRNRDDGKIIGILRTTYLASALNTVLSERVGETGKTDLFVPGDVAYYYHEGQYTQVAPDEYETLQAVANQGVVEMNYEDSPSVVLQVPVESSEGSQAVNGLGWAVVFHQHKDEAFAPVNAQTRGAYFVLVVVLLLAVAAAFGLSQFLVRPITQLTQTAEEIAAGNLNSRAEVTSSDEIGILASTVNEMSSRLRETLQGLEQRVAERTKNLELAAEVGRTVSQVRDLDVMLEDACDLILKEFNLYYVQVYLTNPGQTKLVLEAGTGEVGSQLLDRGHNLPLDTGSINGRAAIEKHSVVISDTAQSATFRPNKLLPDTRGEMAVPLIIADKVVGVLDMQSSQPGVLTEEILPAFEALAGQLAVAVQNANLLAETEQARTQVESQARRLVREGWSEHLDAIHRPEQLGFVFDHNNVVPLAEAEEMQMSEDGNTVSAPIAVTGEALGSLVVELEDESRAEQTSELVNIVARQVAQHIENLRLLESAERYRIEAEEVVRRQTREGWQDYIKSRNTDSLGYLYDCDEVRPYGNGHETNESALTIALKTRDETFGKLSIQGMTSDDSESLGLVNVVAERLSSHIENLRLSEQTQDTLNWQQAINHSSIMIGQAKTIEEITRGVAELLPLLEMRSCTINIVTDVDSTGAPILCDFHTVRFIDNKFVSIPPVLGQSAIGWLPPEPKYYRENRVTIFPDLNDLTTIIPSNAYKAEGAVEYMLKAGMHSAIAMALGVQKRPIGYLTFTKPTPLAHVPEKYISWLGTIVDLISTAIDSQLLFDETKRNQDELDKRARQLASVAEVSSVSSREFDIQKMLASVVSLTQRKFDLYHAHVFLYDENTDELKIAACGWKEGDGHEGTHGTTAIPLNREQSLVAQAARTKKPVIVNNVLLEPGWLPNPLLPDTASELAVPLVIGDKVLGVLDVQSDRVNAFTAEDANIQTTLASQVATALQNAQSFTKAQKQAEREAMLNVINQKIQSATSVEAVLQIAARELGTALGAPMTVAQLSMKDRTS